MSLPPTRWELAQKSDGGYGPHFARLLAEGADVDGEARLADAMLPRGGRVLDVGSGMGRVAAALQTRGHLVVATEPDPSLREQSAATYPHLEVLPHQALELGPDQVGAFDLVMAVGNVFIYLGEGTEVAVLNRLRALLAPGGRVLIGMELNGGKPESRVYPAPEFMTDAAAAGLAIDARFGSYELHPPNDEYAVWVLSVAQ